MDDYLGERLRRERAGTSLEFARLPRRRWWLRRVRRAIGTLIRIARRSRHRRRERRSGGEPQQS